MFISVLFATFILFFIGAWKEIYDNGWKDDFYHEKLNQSCNVSQNLFKIVDCINRKTFNLSEILEKIINGDELKTDITNISSWSGELSNFNLGKAFSLNNSFRIGIDTTSLRIELKKDINCTIRIKPCKKNTSHPAFFAVGYW